MTCKELAHKKEEILFRAGFLFFVFLSQCVLHAQDDFLIVKKKGLFGLIDTNGSAVLSCQFRQLIYIPNGKYYKCFSENKIKIFYSEKMQLDFENCTDLDFLSYNRWRLRRNGKWVLVNNSGHKIGVQEYDNLEKGKSNSVFIVGNDRFLGLIDSNNMPLLPIEYSVLRAIRKDIYVAQKPGRKYFLITAKGKLVQADSFDVIYEQTNSSIYLVGKIRNTEKVIIVDRNVESKISIIEFMENDFYQIVSINNNMYLHSKIAEKTVQINTIPTFLFDSLILYRDSLYWTIRDLNFNRKLPNEYRTISLVDNKFIVFNKNNLWGIYSNSFSCILDEKAVFLDRVICNTYYYATSDSQFYLIDTDKGDLRRDTFADVYNTSSYIKLYKKNTMYLYNLNLAQCALIQGDTVKNVRRISAGNELKNRVPIFNIQNFAVLPTLVSRNSNWFSLNTNKGIRWGIRRPRTGNPNAFDTLLKPTFNDVQILPKAPFSIGLRDYQIGSRAQSVSQVTLRIENFGSTSASRFCYLINDSTGRILCEKKLFIAIGEVIADSIPAFRTMDDKLTMQIQLKGSRRGSDKFAYISPACNGVYRVATKYSQIVGSRKHQTHLFDLVDPDFYSRFSIAMCTVWLKDAEWKLYSFAKGLFTPAIAGENKILFISEFKNNLAAVYLSNGKAGIIDITGKTIVPAIYNKIEFLDNTVVAYFAPTKLAIYNYQYSQLTESNYFKTNAKNNGFLYLFADTTVDIINKFGNVYSFQNGMKYKLHGANGLGFLRTPSGYKLINSEGQVIGSKEYTDASSFVGNLAAVKLGDVWNLILEDETWYDNETYTDAVTNLISFLPMKLERHWRIFLLDGTHVDLPEDVNVFSEIVEGVLMYKRNKKWAAINEQGKKLFQSSFNSEFQFFNSIIFNYNHGKCFIYNTELNKEIVVSSSGLLDANQHNEKMIASKEHNKAFKLHESGVIIYGIEDITLQKIVHFRGNEFLQIVNQNLYLASKNNVFICGLKSKKSASIQFYVFADSNGNPLNGNVYNEIVPLKNGYFSIRKDNLWGLADEYGREVIPVEYVILKPEGSGYLKGQRATQLNFFDRNGNPVTEITLTNIKKWSKNYYQLCAGNKVGYWHPSKGMIWPIQE